VTRVDRTLEPLMYVPGDRVRSIFMAVAWWMASVANPVVVVDLIQFRTADVFNRCSIRRVLRRADVPEAMWHLLDVLVATDALDHDSDPLDELRKPLRCYGGLDGSGRQAPTTAGPSSGASATTPTEGRRMASFEPTQLEPAVPDGRGPPDLRCRGSGIGYRA
jgi:hypothetical protein